MIKLLFFFAIYLQEENIAEISYFDQIGSTHMNHVQYFVKPEKSQFGVKFGVNLYQIFEVDCKAVIGPDVEEYFAALIDIKKGCNVQQIIKEIISHGADFIFLIKNDNMDDFTNNFDVPVFLVNKQSNLTPFDLDISEGNKRYINIFFRMKDNFNQKNNFVKVELFYIPSYQYTSKFIGILKHVHHKLKERVQLVPHVVTFSSESETFIANNCVGNGNYCAFEPSDGNISGRQIIYESIRQMCIYKTGTYNFLKYMKHFYKECFDQMNKECSEQIMSNKGIDKYSIQKCFDDSFHKLSENNYENDNIILKEEKNMQKQSGLHNFPQVIINGQVYKGSLNQDDLLMSLCSSLHDETQQCREIELYDYDDFSVKQLIFAHLGLFLIGVVVMAFVCKYIAKKKYEKKLSLAIGRYVTEYSNIKESDKLVNQIILNE